MCVCVCACVHTLCVLIMSVCFAVYLCANLSRKPDVSVTSVLFCSVEQLVPSLKCVCPHVCRCSSSSEHSSVCLKSVLDERGVDLNCQICRRSGFVSHQTLMSQFLKEKGGGVISPASSALSANTLFISVKLNHILHVLQPHVST